MTRRPGSPTRIGLYTPKAPIRTSEERLQLLEQMYPQPEVDIERELAQLAIIKGVLNADSTFDTVDLPN